eukprot:3935787-Rhodomonas_salina.5
MQLATPAKPPRMKSGDPPLYGKPVKLLGNVGRRMHYRDISVVLSRCVARLHSRSQEIFFTSQSNRLISQ